jgi:hypothetical protein
VTTGEGVSTLEHLAEMDRVLRDIQLELAPDREPAPALADLPPAFASAPPPRPSENPPPPSATETPAPPPAPRADPDPQPQAVSQLAASLLASMRELLDGYEQLLAPMRSSPRPPPSPVRRRAGAPPRSSGQPEEPEVTVAVGPFAAVEALREFEQAVAGLPGVRDVAVRGYEGTDRAIIEVRLARPHP